MFKNKCAQCYFVTQSFGINMCFFNLGQRRRDFETSLSVSLIPVSSLAPESLPLSHDISIAPGGGQNAAKNKGDNVQFFNSKTCS